MVGNNLLYDQLLITGTLFLIVVNMHVCCNEGCGMN